MILRVVRSGAAGAILATAVLLVVLLFGFASSELALDVYVLVLGGIALVGLVEVTTTPASHSARASLYEQALEPPVDQPERPPELARVEREVALAVDSAFYEHYRLRPLLHEIASQRLGERYAAEAHASIALPDHAWTLLSDEHKPPRNPHAPGIPFERLREIVDALEKI